MLELSSRNLSPILKWLTLFIWINVLKWKLYIVPELMIGNSHKLQTFQLDGFEWYSSTVYVNTEQWTYWITCEISCKTHAFSQLPNMSSFFVFACSKYSVDVCEIEIEKVWKSWNHSFPTRRKSCPLILNSFWMGISKLKVSSFVTLKWAPKIT